MMLPSELIEHILSVIPYDEATQSSLPSFALVCRAWAPLVEVRLYRHIIVYRKHQWRKLCKALQAWPHLRGPTRSLRFTNVHVELGPKSLPFAHLLPKVEELSFCENSMSVPVLRQLSRSASETLRHVAFVGTDPDWIAIAEFFRENGPTWESIKIKFDLYCALSLGWGSIPVSQLELTEYFNPEQDSISTAGPSSALTFLCRTSFPDITELVLCYEPLDSDVWRGFRGAELLGVRLPEELNVRLQHVRVELRGWQQVEDAEIFNQIFGQVASRGSLTINTELAP